GRSGFGSTFFWKKCTEHVEIGTRTRCCDGCFTLPKYSHHRIFTEKSKNGYHRKRKCEQRTSRRNAAKLVESERISHKISGCYGWIGCCGVSSFQFGKCCG